MVSVQIFDFEQGSESENGVFKIGFAGGRVRLLELIEVVFNLLLAQ